MRGPIHARLGHLLLATTLSWVVVPGPVVHAADDDPWSVDTDDAADGRGADDDPADGAGEDGSGAADQDIPAAPPPVEDLPQAPPDSLWTTPGPPTDPDPWSSSPPPPPDPAPPPPPLQPLPGVGPIDIPVRDSPIQPGFASLDACRAAWRSDRGPVARLAPTGRHPSVERCRYAAGARRWSIQELPAGMALSAAVDIPVLVGSAGLIAWGSNIDVVARGEARWTLTGAEQQGKAGSGAQRSHRLPTRTSPDLGARTASDVLLYTALGGAALSPLALPERNGWITNGTVMFEIVALQYGVQRVVSGTVAEPRPIAFQDMTSWTDDELATAAATLSQPDAWRSYYSGHTSTVAAVSYGYATIYAIDALDARAPQAGMALLLFPTAFMLANLEGQLRVDALLHDPTDVWVGHLAGAGIGVGVPLIHHLVARIGRDRAEPAPLALRQLHAVVHADGIGLAGRW